MLVRHGRFSSRLKIAWLQLRPGVWHLPSMTAPKSFPSKLAQASGKAGGSPSARTPHGPFSPPPNKNKSEKIHRPESPEPMLSVFFPPFCFSYRPESPEPMFSVFCSFCFFLQTRVTRAHVFCFFPPDFFIQTRVSRAHVFVFLVFFLQGPYQMPTDVVWKGVCAIHVTSWLALGTPGQENEQTRNRAPDTELWQFNKPSKEIPPGILEDIRQACFLLCGALFLVV